MNTRLTIDKAGSIELTSGNEFNSIGHYTNGLDFTSCDRGNTLDGSNWLGAFINVD